MIQKTSLAGVLSSIPHGIVLWWPFLFLAYITDLPESLINSDCQLFADDNFLYCNHVHKDTERDLLQRYLPAFEEWEETWQMSFYLTKWTVIRVISGKRKKTFESNFILDGQTLDVVDSSKYLGVTVSEDSFLYTLNHFLIV